MKRTHSTIRNDARRAGLTLYEVVLSIGIFLMGMAVVSQLISVGTRASQTARLRTQAAMHAESLMAEIVGGARQMTEVTNQPLFEDDTNWTWSLVVADQVAADAGSDATQSNLKDLQLTVNYVGGGETPIASFTLRRLVRDPTMFALAAQEEALMQAEAEQEGASGSSSGSSGR